MWLQAKLKVGGDPLALSCGRVWLGYGAAGEVGLVSFYC